MKKNCPQCDSADTRVNDGHTVFCYSCQYVTTSHGNVSRAMGNKLYSKYGWKILPKHTDFEVFKDKTLSRKKLKEFVNKTRPNPWVRDR